MRSCLLQIFGTLQFIDTSLSRVSNENSHMMQFLLNQNAKALERAAEEEDEAAAGEVSATADATLQ